VLPARPAGAIGVDLEVALVDLDVDVVIDHGIDPHAAEAGVAPRRTVIWADTDQPVHAAFGLGIAIGVFALDQQRGRLDPRLLARLILHRLHLEAALFGPAGIHAQQHFRPVLTFGAARAGVDFNVGIVGVGFA